MRFLPFMMALIFSKLISPLCLSGKTASVAATLQLNHNQSQSGGICWILNKSYDLIVKTCIRHDSTVALKRCLLHGCFAPSSHFSDTFQWQAFRLGGLELFSKFEKSVTKPRTHKTVAQLVYWFPTSTSRGFAQELKNTTTYRRGQYILHKLGYRRIIYQSKPL